MCGTSPGEGVGMTCRDWVKSLLRRVASVACLGLLGTCRAKFPCQLIPQHSKRHGWNSPLHSLTIEVVQESLPKTWSVAQAKNDPGQRYSGKHGHAPSECPRGECSDMRVLHPRYPMHAAKRHQEHTDRFVGNCFEESSSVVKADAHY